MVHLPVRPAPPGGNPGPGDTGAPEFEDTLARITNGIFRAGLALQADLDQPAETLREAAERALDLLDGILRDARSAGLAWHQQVRHDAEAVPATAVPATVVHLAARARPEPLAGPSEDIASVVGRASLAARQVRAQSMATRAHSLNVAALSAVTEDRVAATLSRMAGNLPRLSTQLIKLSEDAASHGARMRQWAAGHADDNAATG